MSFSRKLRRQASPDRGILFPSIAAAESAARAWALSTGLPTRSLCVTLFPVSRGVVLTCALRRAARAALRRSGLPNLDELVDALNRADPEGTLRIFRHPDESYLIAVEE